MLARDFVLPNEKDGSELMYAYISIISLLKLTQSHFPQKATRCCNGNFLAIHRRWKAITYGHLQKFVPLFIDSGPNAVVRLYAALHLIKVWEVG